MNWKINKDFKNIKKNRISIWLQNKLNFEVSTMTFKKWENIATYVLRHSNKCCITSNYLDLLADKQNCFGSTS